MSRYDRAAILSDTRCPQVSYEKPRPTVYRYFDSDGVLLYVGVTANGVTRMLVHAGQSRWWPLAASCTLEHFPNEAEAYAAEAQAIASESPLFNRTHQPEWNSPEAKAIRKAMREAERAENERRMRLAVAWHKLMRLAAAGAPIE